MSLFSHDYGYFEMKRDSQLEKIRGLPRRCSSVKRYQGVRKPKCSGGTGCQSCWAIYAAKHPEFEAQPKW